MNVTNQKGVLLLGATAVHIWAIRQRGRNKKELIQYGGGVFPIIAEYIHPMQSSYGLEDVILHIIKEWTSIELPPTRLA